jgi:hypothetical protein
MPKCGYDTCIFEKQHLDTMKALSGGDDVAKNVFIATAAQKIYK